ncbi:citrate lyase subunit alpha [Klebsiella pneumoniae]|nr:citrate lyase subunit alpha [Klebsiella pneumoniae]
MLNQQYVMPNGLTPYAGVTAKSPWLASESEKRQRKICDSLETAIRRSGLQNGMTISFHHAFRGGDKVVNMVVAKLAEMGFRDLTLASSSLIDAHWPLIEHIKNGVIRQIYTSGLRGKLGEEISAGLMENPVQIHSHGGRVQLIQSGELSIDVAFLGVPCCDEFGNANGMSLATPTALAVNHAAVLWATRASMPSTLNAWCCSPKSGWIILTIRPVLPRIRWI